MIENNKNTLVEIFYHLSQIVKSNRSSKELMGFVVKAALTLLQADRGGGIALERYNILRIEASQGLPKDFVLSVAIPLGEGIIGRVVKEQQSMIISNLTQDPRNTCAEFEEREGIKSLLSVPLYSGEKSYGALFIYSSIEGFFDEGDEQILMALANYMVSLFQQSDLYEDMERRLAELSTLHRASRVINSSLELEEVIEMSLDTLMGIIGIRECALVLFEENGGIKDLVLGMSLTEEEKERVLEDLQRRDWKEIGGQSLAISLDGEMLNLERPGIHLKDLRSHLFLPLKSRDKVIGALAILNFKELPLLEFTNLNFLQAFVNHVSVACQNARFYRKVSKLAERDAMVNLYNHSFFQKALDELLALTEEREWPLSLLLIDIDHFKKVNDTYGHITGDHVLKLLANILKKNTRNDDLVARYGGEEFVLILPGTEQETALKIAERLRNQIENYIFRHDDDYIRITISLGVSTYQEGMTKKELIHRADKALYKSKEAGRNRVTLFKEES